MKKDFKRFLVVSPNKELWDESKPMLFLGEWCNLFKDRNYNKGLDIKIHSYHWVDKKKQEIDYKLLNDIYEQKLFDLSHSLSEIHNLKLDIRYWRIIIGPWLRFFIDAVYDRYESIRTAVDNNEIDSTFIFDYSIDDYVPNDFIEFYDHLRFDDWNQIIFFELIKEFNIPYKKIWKINPINHKINTQKQLVKDKFRNLLYSVNNIFSNYFNDKVFFELYVPYTKLFRLQFKLGQLPYIGEKSIFCSNRKTDFDKRKKINFPRTNEKFSEFLNNQIINFLPRIYLENFKEIKNKVLNKFPTDPKLIITSNAYQANDCFKIWSAHHTQKKVPLIIHQHGGNLGSSKFAQSEDHQLKISDDFISWGWSREGFNNIKTLPALKIFSKNINYDINGDILLTLASTPRYFYHFFGLQNGPEFLDYIEDQKLFIRNLNLKVISDLKIRPDSTEFGWDIPARISEVIDFSKFELNKIDFIKRLKNTKICIGTYNATIFLETLSYNIPTIVFFNLEQCNIRPEAIYYFEKLKSVGIFHDSPEAAAKFLNKIETNIEEWWKGPKLQLIRREFCDKYVNTSKNWATEWSSFLKIKLKE
jgi:putative transferase (TIGR04331 family)